MKTAPLTLAILLLFASTPYLRTQSSRISISTTPACLASNRERDHNLETLIIFDRTTILDSSAKERWKSGINTLFTSGRVIGDIRVLEVRENAVRMDDLGGGCLDRYTRDDPASSDSDFRQRLSETLKELGEFFTGKDDDAVRRRLRTAQEARDSLRLQLISLAQVDKPTKTDSEISVSLIDEIHSKCSHRRVCQIFIFSDLLDTKVKASFKGATHRDPSTLGRHAAEALTNEYRVGDRTVTLRIINWGFGRSDSRPGSALPEPERQYVHRYWSGFFEQLETGFHPSSSCAIANSLDVNFDAGPCR